VGGWSWIITLGRRRRRRRRITVWVDESVVLE
jgi:hypothetical protein